MNLRLLSAALLFLPLFLSAQKEDWQTYYEKSGLRRTPRYAETISYCKKLDKASPQIVYTTFGKSPQGRDLPLLIADRNGNFTPEAVKKCGNAILLIQAGIHAGEIDGKDAGLMLLRDITVSHKMPELLKHVTILFIPIFNVDGHERFGPYNRINQNGPEEMGWRTTAQNLNLNRDYLKADAPEMQSWLALFNRWQPDFFIDCHVTDGADYQYVITYALETKGSLEKHVHDWTSGVCEPFLVDRMTKAGFPIFPYIDFRNWHDPRSGLIESVAPPMLSQGYATVRNRPGLLIETHMLKPYSQRVSATYEMLRSVTTLLNIEYKNIHNAENAADRFTASDEFLNQPFALSYKTSDTDSTMVDFLGFNYTIDTSDLTGGLWFKYHRDQPRTWKLAMFDHCIPENKVVLPYAYILPPELETVIQRLKAHGIIMKKLASETTCAVRTTRFSNIRWQQRPYESHHKLTYKLNDSLEVHTFPAGSILVEMNQPLARVIAQLLEPASPDSFASWGFFDAYLEQKEYAESYVMEPLARQMIEKNPALAAEFAQKKAKDKNFSSDPEEMLNWFYNQSPYRDTHLNVYPVGRIADKVILQKISGSK